MTNDLISREALMQFAHNHINGTIDCNDIARFPAVDAVPVEHGRWIDNGIPESMLSGCSVCGFSCGAYTFNYCPNCGAKMDLEDENED